MPAACRISQTVDGATVIRFRQFAVDPAVSPQRILLRQPNDMAAMPGTRRRAAGLAAIAHVVPVGGQPAVPGQECRWLDGEDFGPPPAGYEPRQRSEPRPVSWLVPDPVGVPAQHGVLVPEHQQLSLLRLVPTECQDSQAEYPANQQVDDLEQHPASQPSASQTCWRSCRQLPNRVFERHGIQEVSTVSCAQVETHAHCRRPIMLLKLAYPRGGWVPLGAPIQQGRACSASLGKSVRVITWAQH